MRVNGERTRSPSRAVRSGDVLTIALDRTVRVLKVAGFAERRGSADDARALFVDLSRDESGPSRAHDAESAE